MQDDNHLSRARKYKKRRSVTRSITIFSLLGVLLVFGLILTFIIGKKDQQAKSDIKDPAETEIADDDSIDEQQEDSKDSNHDPEISESTDAADENTDDVGSETSDDADDSSPTDQESNVDNRSVVVDAVSSDDPNVLKAYEGDWRPVGTNQTEPHEVVFNKESEDWAEMVAAIESVVDIDDMIIHWLGNGGVQKAIGTVSARNHVNAHRVYLTWVPEQGWRPTRVEQLERVEVIKHQSTGESD